MISWLQGQRVGNWQQGLRYGLILDCGGVGYEVQLPRSVLDKLELDGDGKLTLWVHQVQRKDGDSLFGFCRCLLYLTKSRKQAVTKSGYYYRITFSKKLHFK